MASLAVLNPATGETLSTLAEGDVDAACRAADAALKGPWGKLVPRERARLLHEAARLVRSRVGELAELEAKNAGKPLGEARGEMGFVADIFDYYAGAVQRHFGETVPVSNAGLEVTLREPIGVCALIVPWNFPLVIAAWKSAPALACGNTVVLKPAPETPLTALKLAEILEQAGVPKGVFNVVVGGPDVGAKLVEHPLVRKVAFTGSTATGSKVMAACAKTIKKVSLELGGKSANVVFDDVADLEACVEKSLWSVFGNAGQDCCARSRGLIHRKIYDRFVESFVARAKKIVVGDPFDKATQMGPLISARQRERVLGYVKLAKDEGCEALCPGGARGEKGFFAAPAVFAGAKPSMRVFQEEVFGPFVTFTPFDTEEEAIALANDSAYGLSGSLWTGDARRAIRVAKAVQAGVLSVNSSSSVYLEAPFGGYKASGIGRELGMKALDLFSETKSVFFSET